MNSRCTLCAACRSGCPSFDVTLLEGHSGRGRVLLAMGLEDGSLQPDASVRDYLLGCTRCGWCETVCPLDIPVVSLVEDALGRFTDVPPRPTPDVPDLELRAEVLESVAKLPGPVVVHQACCERWTSGPSVHFIALLRSRGVEIVDVPQPACCGAAWPAGSANPQLARDMGLPWIQELLRRGVRTLISNSATCRAHFRELGFEEEGGEVLAAGSLL